MPIMPASVISNVVVDPITISPTTSSQKINIVEGIDGYGPISVNAVTSSIDENIQAGNIKSGVSILGVSGSVTELNGSTKTVTPTTSQQIITPTSPSNGLTSVTVNAVTSAIDSNIQAGNIKKDVTILGVTGTHEGGGGSIDSGVALTFVGNPSLPVGFLESDDWETKPAGTEIPIYDHQGKTGGRIWDYTVGHTRWYYAPFTLVSGTNNNGVCTLNLVDKNNDSLSLNYIKNNISLVCYESADGNTPIYAPRFPQVGDEVYDARGSDNKVTREDFINGTANLSHFSATKKLYYYDSGSNKSVAGPIYITDVKYLNDGSPIIYLENYNSEQIKLIWVSFKGKYYITSNGDHNVAGYKTVNVEVPMPEMPDAPLFATAIKASNNQYYFRNIGYSGSEGEVSTDYIGWKQDMWSEGCDFYTKNITMQNYKDIELYDNWACEGNPIADFTILEIYYGGFKAMDSLCFVKEVDLANERILYQDMEGTTFYYDSLTLPIRDEEIEPIGWVEKVFDSGMPAPACIKDGNGNMYYYPSVDYNNNNIIIYHNENWQSVAKIRKPFGPAKYKIYSYNDSSELGTISKYYNTMISVDGVKYVWDGVTKYNNAIPFVDASGGTVYLDSSSPLASWGTPVYEDQEFMNQIGEVEELYVS